MTAGLLAARGAVSVGQLATEVHPLLGHHWRIGGNPLTIDDVRRQIYSQCAIMSGLDLIDTSDWRVWAVGPSARSLLPGIDVLAEFFANQ